jgi:serine/threonine-protein kinase HipA
MIEDELNVWYDNQIVGYLWRNEAGVMSFQYDDSWHQFPLSISLPLNKKPEHPKSHRFFANLLPEGSARERLCRRLRCPDTDFDLLREIGAECAGAISILPVEKAPDLQYAYQKIDETELAKLIETSGASMTLENKPRLSLAGAQDKMTVHVKNDDIYLPVQQTPSTYILKFEVSDFKNVPLYEVFTTALAHAVGLNTIEIELRQLGLKSYTLSKRYDRQIKEDKVTRIHQEDFCQALGFKEKYQRGDEPNFAQCYQLIIENSSNPLEDAEQLLKWQLFNVIVGNSDAHIKNLSFLYANNQTRLAPFYDLVSTRAIEHLDSTLALYVGKQKTPSLISSKNLNEMGNQCRIRPKRIFAILDQLIGEVEKQYQPTKTWVETQYGKQPALQRIERIIEKQIKLLKEMT